MTKDVIVAVVDGASVRAFHRDGSAGSVDQVAQFLGSADPAELAAILADLGDRFGWGGALARPTASGVSVPAVAAPAPSAALPTAPRAPAALPSTAPVRAEAARMLEYIGRNPGCTRQSIALAFWPGKDPRAPTTHSLLATRLKLLDGAVRTEGKSPARYYAT